MKPTSLSQEFYKNLFDEITKCDFDVTFEENGTCVGRFEVEDFEGLYVSMHATFETEYVDDSFDHLFGTYHDYHFEEGELIEIEDIELYDEDGNDVSDLFDEDMFWEQGKEYGCKVYGREVKPGDEVMCRINYKWYKCTYRYTSRQTGIHYCTNERGRSTCSTSMMAMLTYNRLQPR